MIKLRLITILLTLLLTANSNAAFDIKARTAILQDYLSGEILFEKDADKSIYPASMTKIMTTIIAFDLIKSGDLNLDEKFLVSENAWRLSSAGYSSMFIMVGDEVSVENLLKGIIIASGNDACVALAEGIAGSEENFAQMMNEKAGEIGMTSSNFSNSSKVQSLIEHIPFNGKSKISDWVILHDKIFPPVPKNSLNKVEYVATTTLL